MLPRLRLWLYRAAPFLDRWAEVSPACCGTCPTCLGATATGATMTWLGALRRDEAGGPEPRGGTGPSGRGEGSSPG